MLAIQVRRKTKTSYTIVREAILEDDGDITGDKFIVFKSQLLMLFQPCHTCGLKAELKASNAGMHRDRHILHWQSQPTINHMPAGNLLLAAAILLCGLTIAN